MFCLHLLNTSIIPSARGAFTVQALECSLPAARAIVRHAESTVSHVGHQSTAAIMSTLLGVDVPMSREPLSLTPPEQRRPMPPAGDGGLIYPWPIVALAFQIRGRAPEGTILTAEQIETMGYDLRLLVFRPLDVGALKVFGDLAAFEARTRWADVGVEDPRQEHEIDPYTPDGTVGLRGGRLAVAVRGTDGPSGSTMMAWALV